MQPSNFNDSWTRCFTVYRSHDYIDDILVASANPEEHLHHLCEVCHHLNTHGIVVNPDKCVLGYHLLTFLAIRSISTAFVHWRTKWKLFVSFHNLHPSKSYASSSGWLTFITVHPRLCAYPQAVTCSPYRIC